MYSNTSPTKLMRILWCGIQVVSDITIGTVYDRGKIPNMLDACSDQALECSITTYLTINLFAKFIDRAINEKAVAQW